MVGYDKTKLTTVNLSDAIRLVLIEKLGGWYSDLDMLFLKPIDKFKNALGGDDFDEKNQDPNYLGEKLSNAIFHFEKGHPFIQKSLKYFPKIFTGEWGSGGPSVFQKSLENVCNYQEIPKMMKNEEFWKEFVKPLCNWEIFYTLKMIYLLFSLSYLH